MATYNFHIRELPAPDASVTKRQHWRMSTESPPVYLFNPNSYGTSGEIFVLYPKFTKRPSTTINKNPTNTTTNLYEFRITTNETVQTTYPYNLGFGLLTGGNLLVRSFGGVTYPYWVDLDNSTWTANSWTVGTPATFLSEITTFIAKCCDNSRLLTGNTIEPLSQYSDFNVQTYINGFSQSGTDYTFVVFYPGNDPLADQIITVNT